MDVDHDMGEFEDPFEDEFESDEDVVVHDDDGDAEMEEWTRTMPRRAKSTLCKCTCLASPWPRARSCRSDNSAYEMLHALNVQWPCLSFDICATSWVWIGQSSRTRPMWLAGSQADVSFKNELYCAQDEPVGKDKWNRVANLMTTDDVDADPILEHRTIKHPGGVNRIRAMPTTSSTSSHIVAVWSDMRAVNIYDISTHVASLDTPGLVAPTKLDPLYKIAHKAEGFAMDWSTKAEGHLVTGDCDRAIKLTHRWEKAHDASVEDLQWSPSEATVFASCSADGTMKIFDTRMAGNKPGISAKLANCDVNVISWNKLTPFLMASGHDDGSFAVWDLRELARANQPGKTIDKVVPAAQFAWHKAPITSIEWHSHEESMDDAPGAQAMEVGGVVVPPQLLFIHQGQEYVKEVHWHRQIPGCLVTTAASGFNIFKTINS
ncbi:WD40-repeat-containing domain protein [Catenaria anguillulae PL171]|uniref:WD40-repeat-containing domain protein n=1 Tax=Catenaria anguillulae PL171 TaxID=765915 RepID=A0A1Y2HPU7_9FUNG|nr:WD40-repeat-containing domain protein [Catenaria anguillulae PL171]